MILKDWLDKAAQELKNAHNIPKSDAYKEAHYVANVILGQIVTGDTVLSDIAQYCLNAALSKRAAHMPLAKIAGKKEFYNKMFITNKHTLDPRCETEMIIDLVKIKARTILDLGTGTGCLIICLVEKHLKSHGLAIDISPHALAVAKENAAIYGLLKRIEFKENNWAAGLDMHFDLVVANPPYIDCAAVDHDTMNYGTSAPELRYDPATALYGNIETYKEMINCMNKITFHQMLVETPDVFVDEFIAFAQERYQGYNIIRHEIYSTKISIVEILNNKLPEKILLSKTG